MTIKKHESISPDVPRFDLNKIPDQIKLCKYIKPYIVSLFHKLRSCFDSESNLNLPLEDKLGITFHSLIDGIYRFRVGSMEIELPEYVVQHIDELRLRFLVYAYDISFNGIHISDDLWKDNPLNDIASTMHNTTTRVNTIAKNSGLVAKLLPPRIIVNSSRELTKNGIMKLQQITSPRKMILDQFRNIECL